MKDHFADVGNIVGKDGSAMDGEQKHELCRHGALSECYRIDAATGKETPTCIPTCGWKPDFDIPPNLMRRVGEAVEFDRDCGPCTCFSPLE